MTQFLETLCISDGKPLNLDWHQNRVDATMNFFHGSLPSEDRSWLVSDILKSCDVPQEGIWRCRIIYDLHKFSIEFIPDGKSVFKSLRLIEVSADFDYKFKYADRSFLHDLFEKRQGADDVLMMRKGWLADTTKANIALRAGHRWYTPVVPFLAGTTMKRLITSGVLIPRPIHQRDINRYEAFKIINALNDWDGEEFSVEGILQ